MLELTICKKIVTEMFLSQTHLLPAVLCAVCYVSGVDCHVESWCVGTTAPDIQVRTNQQSAAWENRHLEPVCSKVKKRGNQGWILIQHNKYEYYVYRIGRGGKTRRSDRTAIAERALFFHMLKCLLGNLQKRFVYKAHMTLIGKWCYKNYKGSNCISTSCIDSQGR